MSMGSAVEREMAENYSAARRRLQTARPKPAPAPAPPTPQPSQPKRLTLTCVCRECLKHVVAIMTPKPSTKDIIHFVCDREGFSFNVVMSTIRTAKVARVRQIAMYLVWVINKISYPEIGRRFGGRHHTTVMHAVKTVTVLRAYDMEFDAKLTSYESAIRGAPATIPEQTPI